MFGVSDLAQAVLQRDHAQTKRLLDAGKNVNDPVEYLLIEHYGSTYPSDGWSRIQNPLTGAFYLGPPPVTVLELAGDSWWGDIDWALTKLLIERGANVRGQSAWHVFRYAMSQDRAVATAMLERGFEINRLYYGWTALQYAAVRGDRPTAEFLLQHGSDSSVRNTLGQTAAEVAREKGWTELGDLLDGAVKNAKATATPTAP